MLFQICRFAFDEARGGFQPGLNVDARANYEDGEVVERYAHVNRLNGDIANVGSRDSRIDALCDRFCGAFRRGVSDEDFHFESAL